MAKEQNNCSHLSVDDKSYPDMDFLFETQRSLQEFILKGKKFPEPHKLVNSIAIDMLQQKHALDDEFHELMDALGGINHGIGNAAWKWWKSAHHNNTYTLDNMADNDLIELKMEFVDLLHFVINIGLLLGMNGSEVMNMYLAKNRENIERQKRGY